MFNFRANLTTEFFMNLLKIFRFVPIVIHIDEQRAKKPYFVGDITNFVQF